MWVRRSLAAGDSAEGAFDRYKTNIFGLFLTFFFSKMLNGLFCNFCSLYKCLQFWLFSSVAGGILKATKISKNKPACDYSYERQKTFDPNPPTSYWVSLSQEKNHSLWRVLIKFFFYHLWNSTGKLLWVIRQTLFWNLGCLILYRHFTPPDVGEEILETIKQEEFKSNITNKVAMGF